VALTGTAVSPPIDVLVAGLGRDETLARLAALPPLETEADASAGAPPL
jgi:hypothetical protein